MSDRAVLNTILMLSVLTIFTLSFSTQPARASGTIYIRADGSIDPPTAPISSVDNVTYTLTGNIFDSIAVERDSIVVDGAGYTVQGAGGGYGIDLTHASNVTIKNMTIKAFDRGINMDSYSDYNTISGNNITENLFGIRLFYSSFNNICGNNITKNSYGISFVADGKFYNIVSGNNIIENSYGISLDSYAGGNTICGNNITNNSYAIFTIKSGTNKFFLNNFVNNTHQFGRVFQWMSDPNTWDNGYPNGGNYWSDYNGTDFYSGPYQNETGSDGIGDTPYIIETENHTALDQYPLMNVWALPVLTVQTEGVSSHSPVTVTLNGKRVDTTYDSHPLEISLYGETDVTTATIGISSTRVWSLNSNSRYLFSEWTGSAIGTSTSNPIAITLSKDTSLIANYKIQHLTNITFKDNSGTISLDSMQIKALAPNGSLAILSSFSNQWLDNGTWTLKQVLWQDNNVKPSITPTYNPTPRGTWNVNCRVYPVNFTRSFKDNNGAVLYIKPSSFRLTFPNGTTSPPLTVGTHLIQNGTTTWYSIIWQGTEVVPATASTFDATNGNPTINCRVYSLTVDPAFYDNTGTVIIQPSSWSIEFPNDTIRTVSSSVTYNQTQTGNYSIVSILWKGVEVFPECNACIHMPTTLLTSDKSWSPSINCLLPTNLAISLSSSTSYIGFQVKISGNLTCNELGLSGAPIFLSYSVTGGASWNDITLVDTTSNGGYSALWIPSATGNYLVRATWSGNSTYPRTTTIINLAVTPYEAQYVFSVESNSTISVLAFNTTDWTLSFTATGPNGTRGYVKVAVAKSLAANITNIRVYLDGNQTEYSITSMDDSWLLTFTYSHSTHQLVVDLDTNIVPEFPSLFILPLLIMATLLAAIVYRGKTPTHCKRA